MPDILEVYLMRIENDYHLKAAASDTRDFEAFLRSRLYSILDIGIQERRLPCVS